MASPEQEKEGKRIEAERQELIRQYQLIAKSPAVADLQSWLESRHAEALTLAYAEMDNPVKRSLYLQDAIVYGKVALYLQDKLT